MGSASRLIERHSLAAALAAAGVAAFSVLGVGPSLLAEGGLAPIVTACLVAIVIGGSAGHLERQQSSPSSLERAVAATARITLAVLATGVLAAQDSWWSPAVALGAWPLSWLAASHWGPLLAGISLSGATLLSIVGALQALTEAAPWTLLLPGWSAWTAWLPWSLVAGVMAGGAGMSCWRSGPAVPGRPWLAWALVSLTIFCWLGLSLRSAARFESLQVISPDPIADAVICLAGLAVISAAVSGARSELFRDVGGMAAGSVLVLAPGALTIWCTAGLPLLLAWSLALGIRRPSLSHFVIPGLGSAACTTAAFLAWPGAPTGLLDSGAAALLGVCAFWFIATRVTVQESP